LPILVAEPTDSQDAAVRVHHLNGVRPLVRIDTDHHDTHLCLPADDDGQREGQCYFEPSRPLMSAHRDWASVVETLATYLAWQPFLQTEPSGAPVQDR
jgi:hypothetical protein